MFNLEFAELVKEAADKTQLILEAYVDELKKTDTESDIVIADFSLNQAYAKIVNSKEED